MSKIELKKGIPKITRNKYGFPQLTLLTEFDGEETTDRFTFADVILFIEKHRDDMGKHIYLTEKELMHARASVIAHLCFDCDSMPSFCPYQILVEKLNGKCGWSGVE